MLVKKMTWVRLAAVGAFAVFILWALPGRGAEPIKTQCHMVFGLNGWSIFYESASGTGIVTCNNGQSADVSIRMKGAGVTAGTYAIRGRGKFSKVYDISDLYGDYAATSAHAGVLRSSYAQILTKKDVSLALSAHGRGIGLGVGFSSFTIEPIPKNKDSRLRPR